MTSAAKTADRYRPADQYQPAIDPKRCAASVWPSEPHAFHSRQCGRKRMVGEWCTQHSPDGLVETARVQRERSDAKTEEIRKRAVRNGLEEATVEELRAELKRRKAGLK